MFKTKQYKGRETGFKVVSTFVALQHVDILLKIPEFE